MQSQERDFTTMCLSWVLIPFPWSFGVDDVKLNSLLRVRIQIENGALLSTTVAK